MFPASDASGKTLSRSRVERPCENRNVGQKKKRLTEDREPLEVDLGGNATKLLKAVLRRVAEGMVNALTKNLRHVIFSARTGFGQKKSGSADDAASRLKVWFGRKRNQVAGENIWAVWLTRRKRRGLFLRLLFFANAYLFIAMFLVGGAN